MRLAAGSRDDAVHLYDVGDPVHVRAERTLTAPTEWVNSVAFSPDGRTVLAGSSDAQVRRWNATTGELLDTLPHPGPVTGVAVSPAGDVVATADNDGTARLWHLPTPSVTAAAANLFGVTELPGRGLIATAAKDELRLWRMAGGLTPIGPRLRAPAPYGPLSGPIATSPNGQLVAAGGADGAVHLYDVSHPNAPRLVSTVTGPTALVEGVTISPDGRTLAAGSDDRTVWLWDISRPSAAHPLTHLIGPGNYVQSVAFGPKGRTLAAGDADNDVWLWDVSSPSRPVRLAGPMHGPRSYVYAVTISPDGRTLAAASDDKSVWLWDVSDRRHPKPLGRLQGSDSFLFAVSFSTDGRTLAAASGDGSVWLWDVHDVHHPVATATLTGAVGPLFAAAFLADGRVAAGGTDRMIRLWQTSPNLAARQVCRGIGVPISRAEWGRYVPGVPYAPPCR
jgi:WD40 repeat protein